MSRNTAKFRRAQAPVSAKKITAAACFGKSTYRQMNEKSAVFSLPLFLFFSGTQITIIGLSKKQNLLHRKSW